MMPITLTATVLTALAIATTTTDTTFQVRPGKRLNISNYGGEIAIKSWGRNAVRIEARHSERARLAIEESGSNIDVRAVSRRGVPREVSYRITAPAWMPLVLSGVHSDLSIEGSRSEVSAETVHGRVRLSGGQGFIKLSSLQGSVVVDGARGRLEASSINDLVRVTDVEGEVSVEAINGDVWLEGLRSGHVEAATVNGDVVFVGALLDDGRYRLASHQGDVQVAIPDKANATIVVTTFMGDFDSSFPVRLMETRHGKRFHFVLGTGSARVDLETFSGSIKLRRAALLNSIEKDLERAERRWKSKRDNEREE